MAHPREEPVTQLPVAHGFTLRDLDRLAHTAVNVAFARGMDYTDRYDAAWHAIAETLCTADTSPLRRELVQAGATAIASLVNGHRSAHGITRYGDPAPHHQRYWELQRRTAPSAEDQVVDRTALTQIWPQLSDRHQATLLAQAMHDTREQAAAQLGVGTKTFNAYLSQARRAFLALWHEHEKPSRPWARSYSRRGTATISEMIRTRRRLASVRTTTGVAA